MEEIWKAIKENEKYEISNLGKIRNKKTGRILKTSINNKGYERVIIYINKKPKCYYIHKIVANVFLENPNNFKEINHKDENKLNNCVNNLEWCSSKYNANYGTRTKRILKSKEKNLKTIIQKNKQGNIIKIWKNILEIQEKTTYNKQCIYRCCIGKYKSYRNYIWEYEKL